MSFLAPLFLLGALAVALPILFHLIRRSTRSRVPFSSLMFLLPSPPRLTRRSRLEHLLLLALRATVLGLLALGFARPFFKQALPHAATPTRGQHLLILLDTSASLRVGRRWDQARDVASRALREAEPADRVAFWTFDQHTTPRVTFEQWDAVPWADRRAAALEALAGTAPGWGATDLGNALVQAVGALEEADDPPSGGPRRILLIGDLQEGSRLTALSAFEWPRDIELVLEPVNPGRPTNADLELLADSADSGPSSAEAGLRVRVSNGRESQRETFQVTCFPAGGSETAPSVREVYVPPGQSRVLVLTNVSSTALAHEVVLRGDDEDFDNRVHVIPPAPSVVPVLYLGGEPASDSKAPRYYLERALQPTRRHDLRVNAPALASPPDPALLANAALVVVASPLPDPWTAAVRQASTTGKTVLVVLTDTALAGTLAQLAGVGSVPVEEARLPGYALLGQIDFQHPVFAPFNDPRYADFTRVHFWKHRRVDATALPGARVVARFDSEDPALLEVPMSQGRLLVLAAGWHPADSQLALSTKFVPWLHAVLETTGRLVVPPLQYRVGDAVPLPAPDPSSQAAFTVRLPRGGTQVQPTGEPRFAQTLEPGLYTVEANGNVVLRFAVNLAAEESRLSPLAPEELERLGARLGRLERAASEPGAPRERLAAAELESRQKLWRWLIVAALGVLLIESWLAGRTVRGQSTTVQTGSA